MNANDKRRPKKQSPPPIPKQPKPWDPPPFPPEGDETPESTFTAVGAALSQWEFFEGFLGMLYQHFIGDSRETSPGMRAYGTVATFTARLDMIKEAAKAYFILNPDPSQAELDELLEQAKNFAARRNEIAHGMVQHYYIAGLAPTGFALGPSRHATRKKKLIKREFDGRHATEDTYAYTSKEIDVFRQHFASLAMKTEHIFVLLLS